MNKTILLVVLASLAIAGRPIRSSRIILERNKFNSIDFACGQQDAKGNALILNQSYAYQFSGLPRWLSLSNSRISGIPPADASGYWPVTVRFRGAGVANSMESGSFTFALSFAENQNIVPSDLKSINFLRGHRSGLNVVADNSTSRYTILYPFLNAAARSHWSSGVFNKVLVNKDASQNDPFSTILADLSAQCDALKLTITSVATNITALEIAQKAAEDKLIAAQNSVTLLIVRQRELQARDGVSTAAVDTQIAALQAKVRDLQSIFDNAKFTADNDTQLIKDAQKALSAAQANLTDLQKKKEATAQAAAQNLKASQAKVQEAKRKLNDDNAKLGDAQSAVDGANIQVKNAKADSTSAADRLAKAKLELEAAQKAQNEATSKESQAQQSAQDAQQKLSDAQKAIQTDNQEVTKAQSDVDQANAAINDNPYNAGVEEATAAVSGSQAQLASAQQNAQIHKQNVSTAEANLIKTKNDLTTIQTERDAIVLKNANTKADLAAIVAQLVLAEANVAELSKKLFDARSILNEARAYYARKKEEYSRCQYGFWFLPNMNDDSCQANSISDFQVGGGQVLFTDNNALIVGNTKVYIGACSDRQYAQGKKSFGIHDRIQYEGVRRGGNIWAKKIMCV